MELLERKGETGSRADALLIGMVYFTGQYGPVKDIARALKFLDIAISKGCGDAAHLLGHAYACGENVKPDFEKALQYYEKAVELGKTEARADINRIRPFTRTCYMEC